MVTTEQTLQECQKILPAFEWTIQKYCPYRVIGFLKAPIYMQVIVFTNNEASLTYYAAECVVDFAYNPPARLEWSTLRNANLYSLLSQIVESLETIITSTQMLAKTLVVSNLVLLQKAFPQIEWTKHTAQVGEFYSALLTEKGNIEVDIYAGGATTIQALFGDASTTRIKVQRPNLAEAIRAFKQEWQTVNEVGSLLQ